MKIERVLAPNPGPFTAQGTNTWLVDSAKRGAGQVVVIDPGPVIKAHLDAIVHQIGDRRVGAVIVTHNHPDHAPLANPLARELSAPAYGFAPGPDFEPDVLISDGDIMHVGNERWQVIHTPGHSDDHVCLFVGRVLFTGDHIMGGSSVVVEKMGPYVESLRRLQDLPLDRLYPGHGPEIDRPQEVISWYLAHRLQREQEIIQAIRAGAKDLTSIVEIVYREVDRVLHPLAAMSVWAHLEKLASEGHVKLRGDRVEWLPNDRADDEIGAK